MKIPFGLRTFDGRIVTPTEVENGRGCACVCPGCNQDLIAKQGSVLEWHFAHDSGSDCATGIESAIHRMAKQLIMDRRKLWIPSRVFKKEIHGPFDEFEYGYLWKEEISFEVQSEGLKTLTDCHEEKQLDSRRPDILAKLDGKPIAIEVAYTHFCDESKLEWLRERNLTALEIDLEMPLDGGHEEILRRLDERLFSWSNYSNWLVHASDLEAQEVLANEEKRIRESRVIYDAEFEKSLEQKRAAKKRKDDFKASIKDIDFINLKVDRDLTIRIAKSKIRCTLKWFGNLSVVPDHLKKATREAGAKFGGKFNKEYFVWEFYPPEDHVSDMYTDIVIFMKNSLTSIAEPPNPAIKKTISSNIFYTAPVTRTLNEYDQFLEADEIEFFDERAAINEFEYGMDRELAEQNSYFLVLKRRGIKEV